VIAIATLTATRDVTGNPDGEWLADKVITPVIVPGLAAKRINGVSTGLSVETVSTCDGVELESEPRSIEKPIQTSTLPPAT